MPAGVPETEVFAAADRVLARGERPTVERVRAELGRGSPARIGQLLETWWEALAQRIAGETRLPELPSEVAQAFRAIWETAVTQGREVAEAGIAETAAQLAAERATLAEERAQGQRAVDTADTARQEADRRCEAMELHVADLQALVKQTASQILELTDQRDALHRQRDEAISVVAALRGHLTERDAMLATERTHHDAHIRAVEDRAHAEVDRAREETKSLHQRVRELERARTTAEQQARRRHDAIAADLRVAERQVARQQAQLDAQAQQLQRFDALAASLQAAQAPRRVVKSKPSPAPASGSRAPKAGPRTAATSRKSR